MYTSRMVLACGSMICYGSGVRKACFACGSMVLFYFLSVVFALRGENDRQAWEFTVCVGRIFIAHWYGHGAKNDRQAWEFTVCVGRIFIAHWYGHGAKNDRQAWVSAVCVGSMLPGGHAGGLRTNSGGRSPGFYAS